MGFRTHSWPDIQPAFQTQRQVKVRDKAFRMLEGYLIAFGPAIAIEGDE